MRTTIAPVAALILILLVLLSGCAQAPKEGMFGAAFQGGWWNNSWQYRQQITVTGGVSGTLSNFPVLVQLTNASNPLFSHAQSDGDDILFTAADGTTKLSHEIEEYNTGGKVLRAWVKVPSLASGSVIYMYYGNASSGSQQDAANTWTGFTFVHHLEETSGTHYDSTSNNWDGMPKNGLNQNAQGKIGGADHFDNDSDSIAIPASGTFTPPAQGTLEFWAYADYADGTRQRFMGGDDAFEVAWQDQLAGDPVSNDLFTAGSVPASKSGLALNTWTYLTFTYDSAAQASEIYFNGAKETSWNSADDNPGSDVFTIGTRTGTSDYFAGTLDEIRLSNVVRSAEWIGASYTNQGNPQGFVSFGAEETSGPCTNGETQQCGTTDVGVCEYGAQTCSGGEWGSCIGAVNPGTETCGNSLDDDCDGSTDEGCQQYCSDGTAYGACSTTKPKKCVNGALVDVCSQCGCSAGYTCQGNGSCAYSGGSGPVQGQVVVDSANPQWLKYYGGGPFFMCGPGDPEGFLYRGTRNADGTRSGDQMALINKLKGTGANGIYMQIVRSHGGDAGSDGTQNPFVDSDPSKGLDEDILNQWETWFTEMDNAGIAIFLIFYDDDAKIWSGNSVGTAEKAFIDGIVDRFEHHKHLIWVVAEEYSEAYPGSGGKQRVSGIAAAIKAADNHDHVVAVHQHSGVVFDFPDDPNIDQFAIQQGGLSASGIHSAMVSAWDNAAGKYSLNMSEAENHGTGATARKKNWAIAMGGAYSMVIGWDIAGTAVSDLQGCGRLVDFMEGTNFNEMAPHDELKFGGTEYVLAKPGDSYIAYASALSGNMGIKGMGAGTYSLKWLDTAAGTTATETKTISSGNQEFAKNAAIAGNEVALYIKKTSGAPPETVFPGASWEVRTPGEMGLDAAKLDQFASNVGGVGTIVYKGYVVKEWGNQASKADWASAAKPVTSTLLLFAVKEGKLGGGVNSLVGPHVNYLWGKSLNSGDQQMTFLDLANMTSTYALPEAAGESWGYNDYAINLYNHTLFDSVYGETPNTVALDSGRLGALQFEDGSLFSSREGYGVSTTARDFARIGWFWLNRGNWKGVQLLPGEYFDSYMKPLVPGTMPRTAGGTDDYLGIGTMGGGTDQTSYGPGIYGFNWWHNGLVGTTGKRAWPDAPEDTFQANGHFYKEIVTVIPSLNIVAAARGNWGSFSPGSSGGMNQNLKLLAEAVGEGGGQQYCSDGTAYGECSDTQPYKCTGGTLAQACAECGCPAGYTCGQDGSCAVSGGVFSVGPRPRLLITPERLENIANNEAADNDFWKGFDNGVKNGMKYDTRYNANPVTLAIATHYYKNPQYCEKAVSLVIAEPGGLPGSCGMRAGDTVSMAIVYDLCHDYLSTDEKEFIKGHLEDNGDAILANNCYDHVIQNYGVAKRYAGLYAGIALYGDSGKAEDYMADSYDFLVDEVVPFLDSAMADGFWLCSEQYGGAALRDTMITLDAVNTALGEDYITGNKFFKNAMKVQLHKLYPNLGNPNPNDKGKVRHLTFGSYFSTDPANGDEHVNANLVYETPAYTLLGDYFPADGRYFSEFLGRYPEILSSNNAYIKPGYYSKGVVAYNALFYDPTLQPGALEGLPLAWSGSTSGFTTMRDGWDTDGTYIAFRAGPWYSEKLLLAQNNFSVLLGKAPDVINWGGAYGGSDDYHDHREYGGRTLSTNTFTVYDETEDSSAGDGDGYGENRAWHNLFKDTGYANEGGQRDFKFLGNGAKWVYTLGDYLKYRDAWDAGETLRFESDDKHFSYVAGDAANAYRIFKSSADDYYTKLPVYERELAYLRGGDQYLVIFDRTETLSGSLVEKWQIHTNPKPEITDAQNMNCNPGTEEAGICTMDASAFSIDYYGAALRGKTLLPAQATYRLVGGDGYECWQDELQKNICPEYYPKNGNWRLEVSAKNNKAKDNYLHVMRLVPDTEKKEAKAVDAELLQGSGSAGKMYGALIRDSGLTRVVLFSDEDATPHTSATYSAAYSGAGRHFVFNLAPGIYTVKRGAETVSAGISASSHGVLQFEAAGGGSFSVYRTGANPPCTDGMQITGTCACGSADYSTGYCCSGVWQGTKCTEGCAQGEVECGGVCKTPACALNSDCSAGEVCTRKPQPCYAKCVIKEWLDADGDGKFSLQELIAAIEKWKKGDTSMPMAKLVNFIVRGFKQGYYENWQG
ncbi:MAG: DUF2341 domain-containing protein [Candidatus Diapherotrites archaeon]